jgi:hypothetical protein
MPRFVVLRHDDPRGEHFDLMLECGAALKTWALPEPPQPGLEIECTALADHRLAYLEYQGPVSGGRGAVTRWDSGEYAVERQSDSEWVVSLAGRKLAGTTTLCREKESSNQWRFHLAELPQHYSA